MSEPPTTEGAVEASHPAEQDEGAVRSFARIAIAAIALAGGVRAVLFLAYAILRLDSPVDVWRLESKMVHLAWRVQAGVRFYPKWEDYPHVSNYFGPVYFGVVGTIGRWIGATLDGLFVVGRWVTLAAGVATTLVIGHEARRRYGIVAGLVGAAASLGAAPMDGFGLMVRPDTLAELFGVVGFFLAVGRRQGSSADESGSLPPCALVSTKTCDFTHLLQRGASELPAWR